MLIYWIFKHLIQHLKDYISCLTEYISYKLHVNQINYILHKSYFIWDIFYKILLYILMYKTMKFLCSYRPFYWICFKEDNLYKFPNASFSSANPIWCASNQHNVETHWIQRHKHRCQMSLFLGAAWTNFYGHFLPSGADSDVPPGVVHLVLVNCLGGLSRNSVDKFIVPEITWKSVEGQ